MGQKGGSWSEALINGFREKSAFPHILLKHPTWDPIYEHSPTILWQSLLSSSGGIIHFGKSGCIGPLAQVKYHLLANWIFKRRWAIHWLNGRKQKDQKKLFTLLYFLIYLFTISQSSQHKSKLAVKKELNAKGEYHCLAVLVVPHWPVELAINKAAAVLRLLRCQEIINNPTRTN